LALPGKGSKEGFSFKVSQRVTITLCLGQMPASYGLSGPVLDSKTLWRAILRQIVFRSLRCHEKVTSFYLQRRRTSVVHTLVLSSDIYWVNSGVGSTFQRRTSLLPVVPRGYSKQLVGASLVRNTLTRIRNPARERNIREKLTIITYTVYFAVLIYNRLRSESRCALIKVVGTSNPKPV
jgi:hypothetical protein